MNVFMQLHAMKLDFNYIAHMKFKTWFIPSAIINFLWSFLMRFSKDVASLWPQSPVELRSVQFCCWVRLFCLYCSRFHSIYLFRPLVVSDCVVCFVVVVAAEAKQEMSVRCWWCCFFSSLRLDDCCDLMLCYGPVWNETNDACCCIRSVFLVWPACTKMDWTV